MADSSTDLALRAFESRPDRAEALADLARYYRERGMNETAAMLARRGLAIPPSDDTLFVETQAREEFRSTLAISGYYSKDPETRRLATEAAESLALDRSAARWAVEQARNVLFWHAPRLATLAPSWEERQLEFTPPTGWHAMNPSVVRYRGRTLAIVRCVNYWIAHDGSYVFPEGEPAIRTRNFLCEMDPLHVARDPVEVDPDLGPVLYGGVLGLEDMRLFVWRDEMRFVAACRQMNPQGGAEQVLGRLERDGTVFDMAPVRRPWVGSCEKNWMPLQGAEDRYAEPHFVYRTDPMSIVSAEMTKAPAGAPARWAADNWSGSTALLPFDGGWLALVHEAIASPINGRRCYQHRFVWFDGMHPQKASRRFYFEQNNQIEFAVGLCWHPDECRLLVSYGIRDAEAWMASIEAGEVRELLGLPGQEPSFFTSAGALESWVKSQTNRALGERTAVDSARNALAKFDLPRHPDYPKSWDSYLALWHAFSTTHPRGRVLDAGGTRESVFLRGLERLGFGKLLNVNLDESWGIEGHIHGMASELHLQGTIIEYACADITNLVFIGDDSFHFVACLSVLEHGVDWRKFIDEMARIIVRGGHLFVSFDYWESPIDTGGQMAFGSPVKIFAPGEVWAMLRYAQKLGFEVVGNIDFRCRDAVVNWLGMDFTFLNILFRKH